MIETLAGPPRRMQRKSMSRDVDVPRVNRTEMFIIVETEEKGEVRSKLQRRPKKKKAEKTYTKYKI